MGNYISRFRTSVRKATSLNVNIPDELVAFLMLRKSALAREDRRMVLSSAGGVLDATAIATALKNLYPDEELRLYDKSGKNKRMQAAQSNLVESMSEAYASFLQETDDDDDDLEFVNQASGVLADAFLTKEEQEELDAEMADCEAVEDELEEAYFTYREA